MATTPRRGTLDQVAHQGALLTRELFWQNVVRELLTDLSVMWASRGSRPPAPGSHDVFDGRLGVITQQGNRIPIAAVYPLFACSVTGERDGASRALSLEVECTVFQIDTPEGQSFTLPLHEIRGFHALSADLIEQIKAAADEEREEENNGSMPFGFAAFTSLARTRGEPSPFIGPDFPLPES